MASKGRCLLALVPLAFLTGVFSLAYRQDPDFWRSPLTLYQSAQEAETRQELPLAIRLAEKSWRRAPDNSDCGTFLGWLYLKAGQPEKALALFSAIWSRDQNATAALKGLAQSLDLLDRRAEALDLLGRHLDAHPEDAEVLLFAAQMSSSREEDRELALKYYRQLYRLRGDAQVRRQLVDLLSSLHRFGEAIPLQEEEAATHPQDPEALHRLALLHYWQRDYQAATAVFERLLERVKDQPLWREEAAKAAEAAGDEDAALKHYLWLYGKNQGKKEHAVKLARLWSQKGKHQEAAAILSPLLDDQPDPDLKRWYALELLLTGDLDGAHRVYRQAWEAGDTHQETIINLARLYGRQRQFSRAAAMWDEARRRQLIRGELRWEAALTYSYAHRYGEAVELLKTIPRDHPKYPKIQFFLGQLHFYQKHWNLASHYLQAYLEKQPDDLEAKRLLAEALAFQPERLEEASGAYGELANRGGDPGARLRRIALLLEAGKWETAEKELKSCPPAPEPQLLQEQARLCLWAGDLEGALACLKQWLHQQPHNLSARLLQARTLIHLGRPGEAQEALRRLPTSGTDPQSRAVLVVAIEAALAQKDWTAASHLALRLFGSQFRGGIRPPQDWREARRRLQEYTRPEGKDDNALEVKPASWGQAVPGDSQALNLEERTWVARALCHHPSPEAVDIGVDLAVVNLRHNRYHHASLLILEHLAPRLSRYEDLSRLVYRIPGIRVDGPEYAATLAYFNANSGRHGGKLDYLLHVLREYRRHKPPRNPGELLGLAALAMELEAPRVAAEYFRLAQRMKPQDARIAQLLSQCQMMQGEFGPLLARSASLPKESQDLLAQARLYLMRGQYAGVEATAAQIPPTHPDYVRCQLLLVQAQRLERRYPEALRTLEGIADRAPAPEVLMEKAQILEGQGDRRAAEVYEAVIRSQPHSQTARVAAARRARARGDWTRAYDAYAQALQHAPQDVALLNELEFVKQQMRPQLAARGFAYPRGERRPEEGVRPWQFSRYDRDWPQHSAKMSRPPILVPESLYFDDSNGIYGTIFRASAGFRIGRTLPLHLAVEFREYHQTATSQNLGGTRIHKEIITDRTRVRRLEVAAGLGPLSLHDRLRLSGELIWRGYGKRLEQEVYREGHLFEGGGQATSSFSTSIDKDHRDRMLGSCKLDFALSSQTDVWVRYSRRDIFDQDPHVYPRLFQSVSNLAAAGVITYHQVDLGAAHQFRPGLEWQTNLAGAFFSDHNRRFTLYQGVSWEALGNQRMRLTFTPHYYLALYQKQDSNYFSPPSYHALGLTVDFHRQVFRLPTLILQGSLQAVGQHGTWGPAFQGLAALEWEPVHNFFLDPHVFYFREWVDNYHILSAGLSLRYVF